MGTQKELVKERNNGSCHKNKVSFSTNTFNFFPSSFSYAPINNPFPPHALKLFHITMCFHKSWMTSSPLVYFILIIYCFLKTVFHLFPLTAVAVEWAVIQDDYEFKECLKINRLSRQIQHVPATELMYETFCCVRLGFVPDFLGSSTTGNDCGPQRISQCISGWCRYIFFYVGFNSLLICFVFVCFFCFFLNIHLIC